MSTRKSQSVFVILLPSRQEVSLERIRLVPFRADFVPHVSRILNTARLRWFQQLSTDKNLIPELPAITHFVLRAGGLYSVVARSCDSEIVVTGTRKGDSVTASVITPPSPQTRPFLSNQSFRSQSHTRESTLTEKIMATEDGKTQEELLDYEEDEEALVDAKGDGDDGGAGKDGGAGGAAGGTKKGHYVGIHASGFRDFLLKPELLRAVVDCGFEHPSEVQHECIPQV